MFTLCSVTDRCPVPKRGPGLDEMVAQGVRSKQLSVFHTCPFSSCLSGYVGSLFQTALFLSSPNHAHCAGERKHYTLGSIFRAAHYLSPSKPSLTVAKSFAGDNDSIALVANNRSGRSDIAFRVQIESNAIHGSPTASSPVKSAIGRTLSNPSEAAQTSFEREVDTIGRALVDDVEIQARVVDGIVEGGVIIALSNVHALVKVAEVVESFVCDDFSNRCCGAVAIQFSGLQAWAELVCGWDWWDLDLMKSQL
jgi:hypothetical protein